MTTATSSPIVRFGRRLAKTWAEIDDAQRRMFEIRIGVRPPARAERQARRSPAAGRGPRRRSGSYDNGAAAGLMC
jgi:hypothetical protein